MNALAVEREGRGPPVVLVHGSVVGGRATWSEQLQLAERWKLLVVDRTGFAGGPLPARLDFEAEAALLVDVLGAGAHLVGHSYGGVVALLAAARRPEAVRSLAVSEPPAFGVAAGDPAVAAFVATLKEHWANGPPDPEAFLRRFLALVGSDFSLPSPLPGPLERGARILMVERGPWEARIPLEELASASFPKLVVSGAHHPAFDAVCDVLEERLGAERAVIPGSGHSVQRTGAAFNERLESFLREAEGS